MMGEWERGKGLVAVTPPKGETTVPQNGVCCDGSPGKRTGQLFRGAVRLPFARATVLTSRQHEGYFSLRERQGVHGGSTGHHARHGSRADRRLKQHYVTMRRLRIQKPLGQQR